VVKFSDSAQHVNTCQFRNTEQSTETYAQAKNIAEQQISTVQAKTAGMTLADNLQAGIFYTATSMCDAKLKQQLFIIHQNEFKN